MMLFIKQYREDKNIDLRSLAIQANCSYSYLNQLENNIKKNPGLDILVRVGYALQVCPIRLLGGCYGGYCNPKCYYYKSYYIIP
ncbi:helix-turn-helix domain-containing protein [Clostridium kluyveri]|uniref:HTH cro/C1-type domain-containing protein n=1 Tax=Clostridium kluyveri TaxID=1534 RepID=A0A1L5F2T6_CLOKL|nr:helix-turn-helix transcriptional regulator [Clostridium kluyveri]APM37313.1 hypothetical protein BS101_00300 [Clostridium kluyveri]